jgi:DNA-binding LytR/AlgR family response regulator
MAQPQQGRTVSAKEILLEQPGLFELLNPKGRVVLSIPFDSLLCFEANDNYINIYFEGENGLQKRMERLSMKKVEVLIDPVAEQFLRVHKSYLINRQKVRAIHGKAQNYQLQMDQLDFEVPVSRRMPIYDYFPNI